MANIGNKALKINEALQPFEALVGEWETTGSHPYFPGVALHGRASFAWHEGGAFLISHSEIDHPDFPSGVEIFASDDAAKEFFMLHFDERGVSRKYDVSIDGNKILWQRINPEFSQRFVLTINGQGNEMVAKGEMSQKGKAWEKDLELVYRRLTTKNH